MGGSTPRFSETSMVSSNLAVARLFTRPMASSIEYSLSRFTAVARALAFLVIAM